MHRKNGKIMKNNNKQSDLPSVNELLLLVSNPKPVAKVVHRVNIATDEIQRSADADDDP